MTLELIEVQNLRTDDVDLPLGEVTHFVQAGGTIKVPADIAKSLLEQKENWGPVKAAKTKKETDS